jgi:hypothetical protein
MDIRMDNPRITLAVAVIGGLTVLLGQHLMSSREYDAKMVEIAINVLRADPKKGSEDLKGVREWATGMIMRHSGVPLKEEAKRALENKKLEWYGG